MRSRCVFAGVALLLQFTCAATVSKEQEWKQGHSHIGPAWDAGPRQKPWVIAGIGEANFPVTTANPEVQKWFNQGNALLHSFWYWEAERSFRWAQKLEPENPMVYWGLARATSGDRAQDFIREAFKRKDKATERERLYIEALAKQILPDPLKTSSANGDDSYSQSDNDAKKILETLCVKYPDDMEARALLALWSMGGDRYGTELMIREVLSKQPQHPGAHHYRIHNWDYHEPQQALESSRRYGQIAPGIGHALHMPGHIFSIVGMWNEAAISMDAATRAEKKYMRDTLTFPFNNWNYGHNRYYLSYIQEQLGMPSAAIFGVRQLVDAPKDPQFNNDEANSSYSYGVAGLVRAALRFERWDDLANIPWRPELTRDKFTKAYTEARLYFGKNDIEKAEKAVVAHQSLRKDAEKEKGMRGLGVYEIQALELKARLALAKGQTLQGLSWLSDAAEREDHLQRQYADPPSYPEVLWNALGEEYLKLKSPGLAITAFEKGLDLVKNDIFALSGLIRAHQAAGNRAKAAEYMGQLAYITKDAEPGITAIQRAKQSGIEAEARPVVPSSERNYVRTSLESFGPNKWDPYNAPELNVRDKDGKRVSLSDYKGKNVVLVFYLGEECPHCMQQLRTLGKKKDEWQTMDTVLLGVSSALPKKNADSLKDQGELPFRLLSDAEHVNARRFGSWDDFEEMELHSTLLIDKKGRVYWGRIGGDPFSDTDFIQKQLERMNALVREEEGETSSPRKTVAAVR